VRRTVFDTPIAKDVLRGIALLYMRVFGWRIEGEVPPLPKFVVVIAPHTSNWDFPTLVFLAFVLKVKVSWLGKDSMFWGPFGPLFRWLGGIPIDRSARHGVVGQTIQHFDGQERLIMALAPEGTRDKVERWKTGFYHMARGAGVPIVLVFADYGRKVTGVGPTIVPTDDVAADMEAIRRFYAPITARHPEKMGLPEVPPADQ